MVSVRVEKGFYGKFRGVSGEGEYGDVGGRDGVEVFVDGRKVSRFGFSGARI